MPNLLKAVSILIGFSISNWSSCPSSIYIKRYLLLASEAMIPTQHIEKQRHHFANKGPYSQSYGFSSSHVWMWELYHKEGWALKNWCFWTVVLEKTLERPFDCKEIKSVNPKGNQHWIFIGKIDAETAAPVLWPPDAKGQLFGKDLIQGKTEGRKRRGNRGWDVWMTSPTRWTWVWANSRRWWRTGKPGKLQSMGLQSWTWLRNWITTINLPS